jgi:hypothetical protein
LSFDAVLNPRRRFHIHGVAGIRLRAQFNPDNMVFSFSLTVATVRMTSSFAVTLNEREGSRPNARFFGRASE